MVIQQAKFAQDVAKLIQYIDSLDLLCTFGEAYRTTEQAQWYADKGVGILYSLHCQRLAIDLNLFTSKGEYLHASLLKDAEAYALAGKYWKTLDQNNVWGGDFVHGVKGDFGHFERNP